MFVNRSVEEWGQDWCKEGCEVFDEDWFDFVDVACFVAVDFFHCFCEFVFCYMSECEGWDGVGWLSSSMWSSWFFGIVCVVLCPIVM